jgi:hypothetical protein
MAIIFSSKLMNNMVMSSNKPDIWLFLYPVSGKSNPVSGRIPDIKMTGLSDRIFGVPYLLPGLWIRIESGFNDFVKLDPRK